MLPFLAPKHVATVIISKQKEDGTVKDDHVEGEEHSGMIEAMEDLIRGMNMKNASAMAEAFKAAFEICESEPHEESEHLVDGEM
jgi:hypothetical protein